MSQPEGEGAQSGAEGTQSGAGEATGTGTETDPSNGTQSGTAAPTEAERIAADLAATQNRMKAADQRAAKLEAELKQLRDKDLPEAEKLKRDFEATQKQVIELQDANKQLALKNAFFEDNTYTWHNPKRALSLVDLSQVEINADGSVSGLKEALRALATSDAYLLKTEADAPKNEPGGTSPGNNGGSSGGKPDTKKLAARIPAMQTRVKRG